MVKKSYNCLDSTKWASRLWHCSILPVPENTVHVHVQCTCSCIAWFVFILFFVFCFCQARDKEQEMEISNLQKLLDELRRQISQKEKTIRDLDEKLQKVVSQSLRLLNSSNFQEFLKSNKIFHFIHLFLGKALQRVVQQRVCKPLENAGKPRPRHP